jgi:hypothetical protein
MKEKIKKLRVHIDGLIDLTKTIRPIEVPQYDNKFIGQQSSLRYFKQSEELKEAIKSLKLARCWLGKMLECLGEETPYRNDGNRKTVEDIEPASDKAKESILCAHLDLGQWERLNLIEKIDWLREEIIKTINESWKIKEEFSTGKFNILSDKETFIKSAIASTNVYTHLSEARFWLGFELSRILDSSKN